MGNEVGTVAWSKAANEQVRCTANTQAKPVRNCLLQHPRSLVVWQAGFLESQPPQLSFVKAHHGPHQLRDIFANSITLQEHLIFREKGFA